jgi:ribosomal protein S4
MVLKVIWRKVRLYKRFEMDIWGRRLLYSFGKSSRMAQLFNAWDAEREEYRTGRRSRLVYRVDIDQPARIHKRQKWAFVTRRLSRLFYLTLSYAQFRKLAKVASRLEGSWESSFIMLVENRVLGMLYRMQINMNVFELRWFVLRGNVFLNNRAVTYYNAAVDYFVILRIKEKLVIKLRAALVERFKIEALYFGIPKYMFVSYKYMFAFVYKEPKRSDLSFPIKAIDVYRSADFY